MENNWRYVETPTTARPIQVFDDFRPMILEERSVVNDVQLNLGGEFRVPVTNSVPSAPFLGGSMFNKSSDVGIGSAMIDGGVSGGVAMSLPGLGMVFLLGIPVVIMMGVVVVKWFIERRKRPAKQD